MSLGEIKYHGESCRVEIFLPEYIGKWIEAQAKLQQTSPSIVIKRWIKALYEKQAEHVGRR